ncbi:MAG: hypothetical protein QG671_3508 [Actinomycetota bacterium]|nr:hypothetical protein [Actinomycetota bacterium]
MTLLLVQDDAIWVTANRKLRFAMPVDCAASPAHYDAIVKDRFNLALKTLRSQGYELRDTKFEVTGPHPHLVVSDDTRPDPGPIHRYDPRDLEAAAQFERAEKARLARNLGETVELVDYIIHAKMKRRARPTFHRA